MMPMPPSSAMAIANSDSVTVSIAAESNGILIEIFCVSCVANDTSLGNMFDRAGTNKISSNVKACSKRRMLNSLSRKTRLYRKLRLLRSPPHYFLRLFSFFSLVLLFVFVFLSDRQLMDDRFQLDLSLLTRDQMWCAYQKYPPDFHLN